VECGESIQEEVIEVVAEAIKVEDPEPEKYLSDNTATSDGEESNLQTSMVSHMVSSPQVDSDQSIAIDKVEIVPSDAEINKESTEEEKDIESNIASNAIEQTTSETVHKSDVVVEPVDTSSPEKDAEQDETCSSMVTHTVVQSNQHLEDESNETVMLEETSKHDVPEPNETESKLSDTPLDADMNLDESQIKAVVPEETTQPP